MPFDPAGRATLPASTWATAGQTIRTEQHNPPFRDIEAMLSSVLVRDGRAGMVGPLPMSGFPITNLGASADPSHAATVGQVQGASPVGVVVAYAGSSAPSGWLLCFGQAVSRASFPELFAVIGTTYGAGDGATTFNLPDCRDVAIVGRGNMGGTAKGLLSKFTSTILGAIFGVQEHTLTTGQLPKHQHGSGTLKAANGGGHTHPVRTGNGGGGAGNSVSRDGAASQNMTNSAIQVSGEHEHNITGSTAEQGSDQPHPNVQPSLVMNYIIKASYA